MHLTIQFGQQLYLRFLDNHELKHQFINTYCDRINTTYSTDHTSFLIDSLKAVVAPYVVNHIFRYGSNPAIVLHLTHWQLITRQFKGCDFASYRP